jgi:hypothetical protein
MFWRFSRQKPVARFDFTLGVGVVESKIEIDRDE